MNKRICAAKILAAGSLWGSIGVFLRLLTAQGLSSVQAVVVRAVCSAVMMAVWMALKHPSMLKISPRDGWMFFGTGVLSLFFFNWCYFGAIKASNMAAAAVLLYTAPIFVVLMSAALFRERLTRRKLFALAMTFAGCALVAGLLTGGGGVSKTEVLLGLGAGFGYALYSIFSRFALRKYHSLTITLWTFVFCAAASSVFCAVTEGLPDLLTLAMSWQGIAGILGISLVCCVLPYILYTAGLSGVETGQASIMATIEPAVAALIGTLLFREPISLEKLAGMALIFGAILLLKD